MGLCKANCFPPQLFSAKLLSFQCQSAVVLQAYLAADTLRRLLGPAADSLGNDIERFVQQRKNTFARIISNAEKKAGPRLDSPGRVPLKVLKEVINEGSYTEDPIAVEYFGGVLASSRTEIGRDDRGARLAKTIDNLSTYQLRTHYLIYSTVAHLFSISGNKFGLSENRTKMEIFFPFKDYFNSMAFTQSEGGNPQIMSHIWHGLYSEDLIENRWQYGDHESLQKIAKIVPGDGIICQPSALGAELYLWAFGHGDKPIDYILARNLEEQADGLPGHVPGAIATKQPQNT